jgi:hypothetical protein
VGAAVFLVPFAWMLAARTVTRQGLGDALQVAWGFMDPPLNADNTPVVHVVQMSALLQWIPLAGAGLALIVLRLRGTGSLRIPVTLFVTAVLALLAVDLFRANMGYNPAITKDNAVVPATESIRYLQRQAPNRFAGLGLSAFEPLPADMGMVFGLYDARGYDYPTEGRYDRLWRRYVNSKPTIAQPTERADTTPEAIRALGLLSTSDLLVSPGEPPLHAPGLRRVYGGDDAVVYRNDNALPRAFVVNRQRTVESEGAALRAVMKPGFDGRRVAVTENALDGLPQDHGSSGGAPAGSARLDTYEAERATVTATSSGRGLLVLTDVHYPGWKAKVDGRDAPIERVNYLMRGVQVPAGTHRVEFTYEPASFRAGWIISLVATLGVLMAALVGWRDQRRRRRRPAAA